MWELPELDPALVERLLLDDDAFDAMVDAFTATVPARAADERFRERALGYPWTRPDGSYLLDGDGVTEAPALSHAARDAYRRAPRVPLLAIGSNGAPSALIRKFSGLAGEDARILVETGWVQGIDIGAVPVPTIYGSFAATPIQSPKTHVRASMLWATPAQLEVLTWSEISYWLGRLDGHPFVPDDGEATVDRYLLFAARWGALRLDDERIALAAIPARERTARAATQLELLDRTGQLWLGPDAGAADLLQRLATDLAPTRRALLPLLRPLAEPFAPAGWQPLPAR